MIACREIGQIGKQQTPTLTWLGDSHLVVADDFRGSDGVSLIHVSESKGEHLELCPQASLPSTERRGEHSGDVRYYLSSRKPSVGEFSNCSRRHWGIESMHWVLDVVYHEDSSRLRTKNATSNMSFARRFVTTLLKRDTAWKNLRRKRKMAGWNTEFLQKLLFPA